MKRMLEVKPVGDAREEATRTYAVTGPKEFLERLEKHLAFIQYLGSVGHSAYAGIFVDGDGADRVEVKPALKRPSEGSIKTKGKYPDQFEYAS